MEELSSGGPNKRQRVAQPASNATNGRQAVPAPPTVEGSPPLLRSMECTRLTKVLSSSSPPTSVLIAGGSGSGKTTLVRNAIKSENDCVVAWINCEFIMSKKDLYRSIIFHLLSALQQRSGKFALQSTNLKAARCEYFSDLVEKIRVYYLEACMLLNHGITGSSAMSTETNASNSKSALTPTKLILVFEAAQHLLPRFKGLLAKLAKLHELTSANVQCVFITELLTPYLRSLPPIDSPPFVIHLKPWNEEESAAILVEEYINNGVDDSKKDVLPAPVQIQLFTFLTNYVCGRFHGTVRGDLPELRALLSSLFPAFVAPVFEGKVPSSSTSELLRLISPKMSFLTRRLYLHDFLSDSTSIKDETGGSGIELPYLAKFFLVGAFCASHNPQDTDNSVFARGGKRKRRRRTGVTKTHDEGPRSPIGFPLERLIAIVHALLVNHEGPEMGSSVFAADAMHLVTSLARTSLLAITSSASELDSVRLRCEVGFEVADQVAKQLGIELRNYLIE